MIKKVKLSNVNTGRSAEILVETDTDEKALIGSGKAGNEIAKITTIEGIDEVIQRATSKKPNMDDKVQLFSGVARCLERNISTIKSFQLQANRVKAPRFKGAIADISTEITNGEKVSDAMEQHGELFGESALALVRAGEEAGQLPEVFNQMSSGQKKTLRIVKKLKMGMIYPGIVLFLGVVVIMVMSYTLVPAVAKLYGSFGSDLPLATKVMMALSDALTSKPYLALLPIAGMWALFKYWGKICKIEAVQRFWMFVPTVGTIVRKSAAATTFRTLGMLMEANVRISTALQITAESATHVYYKEFFGRVKTHVEDGLGLSEAFLIESHWLGQDGRNISAVMEISSETGSSTDLLNEIADDYEDELDSIAGQIDKILEPITIVILGPWLASSFTRSSRRSSILEQLSCLKMTKKKLRKLRKSKGIIREITKTISCCNFHNEASPGQALLPRARLLLRRSGVSSKCCFIESAASGGELDP
jgi:type II secretory pathway component PulF